jgi:hypothetical protein
MSQIYIWEQPAMLVSAIYFLSASKLKTHLCVSAVDITPRLMENRTFQPNSPLLNPIIPPDTTQEHKRPMNHNIHRSRITR